MAFGLGKSKGKTSSSDTSFIDPTQQRFLTGLYNQGLNTFNRVQPELQGVSRAAGTEAQDVNRELTGRQRQIAGGTNPFIQNLLQRTTGDNPYLQQQVDSLGTDIQRQTTQALQGVGQGFASAGQFGSGRQGLAEGEAIGRGVEEFAQGSANLRAEDLINQQAAAEAGAGLQLDASVAGQQGAQSQFELAIAPLLAQFGALESFSGLIGDPTVIGSGQSSGKNSSFDVGL